MSQGSPKSVSAVNRPVTLTTDYARMAPTVQRQHTWRNLNTAPIQSRRGHNDGTRSTRGGINKRKKRRKSRRSRRKKRRKSRKSKKRCKTKRKRKK